EWHKVFGAVEALQSERTELHERPVTRKGRLENRCRGARNEDLTSVGRRTDPRRAMYLEARVAVCRALHDAGVDSDARADDDVGRPGVQLQASLDGDGRSSRLAGCRKRAERSVSVEVDDRAPLLKNGVCQKRPKRL